MGVVINGRELADKMQMELKQEVKKLKEENIYPTLIVFLIGENHASQTYVRNKEIAAAKIGIQSEVVHLPEHISELELLERIEAVNQDTSCHGILIQLPLPKHINEEKILLAVTPEKDVDGFHPMNMGHLFIGEPTMLPCTPFGIMKMFEAYGIELEGKQAVIIGRSNIVGKPMAQLLLMKNATVTVAHSKTKNLPAIAKEADILVVAIGKSQFVTKEFIKPGAVVIDVGMNRDENGKLVGDVKFDEVKEQASFITPVPKGVGPMTITMLMYQTVKAAKNQK